MSERKLSDYYTGNDLTREVVNVYTRDLVQSNQPLPQTFNQPYSVQEYIRNDYDYWKKQNG